MQTSGGTPTVLAQIPGADSDFGPIVGTAVLDATDLYVLAEPDPPTGPTPTTTLWRVPRAGGSPIAVSTSATYDVMGPLAIDANNLYLESTVPGCPDDPTIQLQAVSKSGGVATVLQPSVAEANLVVWQDAVFVAPLFDGQFERFPLDGDMWATKDFTLLWVMPHMHVLGKEINVTMTPPDATEQKLLAIKSWDYNWQEVYFLKEPVQVKAGTRFRVEAFYDNTEKNPRNPFSPPRRVTLGEQTYNEMCFVFLGGYSDAGRNLAKAVDAVAPSITRWSAERLSGSSRPTPSIPSRTTTPSRARPTARIPASG